MAIEFRDCVLEFTDTTGTGALTLTGTNPGFRTALAAFGSGDHESYWVCRHPTNGQWEMFRGTVNGATLTRTAVLSSSNSNTAVNFAVGRKEVRCTLPAEIAQGLSEGLEDLDGMLTGSGTDNSLTRWDEVDGLQNVPGWSASDAGKVTGRSSAFPAVVLTDGATVTLDLNAGNFFEVTIEGNRTLALSNATVGQNFTLAIKQGATGSRTVTWWNNIYWPAGTAPTLTTIAHRVDEFGFRIIGTDGYGLPVLRGHILGQNFAG